MTDVLGVLSGAPATQAELGDQRRRLNQDPAINDAQVQADIARAQPPVGTGMAWFGSSDPADTRYMICNGRMLAPTDYPDLFAVIGNTFNNGDEGGNFRLPDLRSRVPLGAGAGAGLTNRSPGTRSGTETETLDTTQIPAHSHSGGIWTDAHSHGHTASTASHTHSHTIDVANDTHNHGGDSYADLQWANNVALSGGGGYSVAIGNTTRHDGNVDSNTHDHNAEIGDSSHSHAVTVNASSHSHTGGLWTDNTGGGQSHNNMPPFLAVNFIIRVAN